MKRFLLCLLLMAPAGSALAQPSTDEGGDAPACADGPACFKAGAAAYKLADYAGSFAAFRRAADLGYAAGFAAVAEHYELGRGVATDLARALALYRQGCDAGQWIGCFHAARCYRDGKGAVADLAERLRLLSKGCDLGGADACNDLGVMYDHGEATPVDKTRARSLFERACTMKSETACKNLGIAAPPVAPKPAAPAPPTPPPAPTPPATPEARCSGGDQQACIDWGWQLEQGDGVKKDVARASKLYDQACRAANQEGCALLGMRLLEDPQPDVKRAKALFEGACNAGLSLGCRELGFLYKEGRGVVADQKRAEELFERACGPTDADADACGALGFYGYFACDMSNGGKPCREALTWVDRGCALDSAEACDWVGVYHLHLHEYPESMRGYAKACALGNGHACDQGEYHVGDPAGAAAKDPARAALFHACGQGDKAKCAALMPK